MLITSRNVLFIMVFVSNSTDIVAKYTEYIYYRQTTRTDYLLNLSTESSGYFSTKHMKQHFTPIGISKLWKSISKLCNKSKFFRIISLVTGSFAAGYSFRNLYIWSYRKIHCLPTGSYGFPLLGNGTSIFDPAWLKAQGNGGVVSSYMMGPAYGILINEPNLATKLPPTANNTFVFNEETAKLSFAAANGKMWKDRRRMIYAKLMSTMKASYVEKATKKLIKTKVFPAFNKAAKDNQPTQMRPLFRPIGFNIVCQACFGKELQSLQDPFWLTFDKKLSTLIQDLTKLYFSWFLVLV